MVFFARLKRSSSIYNQWRTQSRLAGFIDNTFFKLKGSDFVTGRLDKEQVDKIKARQDQAIELEAIFIDQPILEAGIDTGPSTADQNMIPIVAEVVSLPPRRSRLRK